MDRIDRAALAAMPLHEITTSYGERGLRERFGMEIAGFPDHDRERLERALELSSRLHASDRRPDGPYANHVLRVATRIICYYDVEDADVVCAALLHDAVEDHAAELAAGGSHQEALATLAAQFGSRVAGHVAAVTLPDEDTGPDRYERYRAHVAEALEPSPWGRVIKMSDFADNGLALIHTKEPELIRLVPRYAPLVPVLRDLLTRRDTPLGDGVKARIAHQLDRAEEELATLGGG